MMMRSSASSTGRINALAVGAAARDQRRCSHAANGRLKALRSRHPDRSEAICEPVAHESRAVAGVPAAEGSMRPEPRRCAQASSARRASCCSSCVARCVELGDARVLLGDDRRRRVRDEALIVELALHLAEVVVRLLELLAEAVALARRRR